MGRLLLTVALFAVSAYPQAASPKPAPAQATCTDPACVGLKKILAERASGFVKLRGVVLMRRSGGQPGEYDGKVKLPGAKSCTVETLGAGSFYLCLFPSQPYAKVQQEYSRYAGYAKQAVSSSWVTWEVVGKEAAGRPGPSRSFRAAAARGPAPLEVTILTPAKKPPQLMVMFYDVPALARGR
jgi:hypothetical protein